MVHMVIEKLESKMTQSAIEVLSEDETQPATDDSQTIHIVELCIVCYFSSNSWYSPGREYLTLCGKYESNPEEYLDFTRVADCVDCFIAIPTNICVICGKEIS